MAYIGVSPQNGVRKKHTYTASGSQTSFTGAGAEGITLSYKDSNFVDVYQNGVKLAEADYTSTTGTTIVLAQGAAANDIVEIIVFDVFSTSDMVSASDGGTFAGNVAMSGTLTLTGNGDFNGDLDVDGTLETDALTINGVTLAETISDTVGAMVSGNTETGITVTYQDGDNTLDFVVGTLNQDTTGTAANATLAATVTVTDSTANTNFPIVFHDESNALLDDTGALRYNPSTGELLVPKLTVAGTTTTVDTVTMNAANAVIFEGATADAHETTLTIVDPTADRTINLPNVSGTVPVLAAASNTAITSTPAELNLLDGATVVVGEINALDLGSTAVGTAIASKAVILDSNKDYTGIRNFTTTGVVTSNAGVVVDNITIDGTEIDLSSGDLTIDVAGDIILDADGGDIQFNDGGTHVATIKNTGSAIQIRSEVSDADLVFVGNDGGAATTMLTLDTSLGGVAKFNAAVQIPQYLTHLDDTDTFLEFGTDQIDLYAGNAKAVTIGSSQVIINQDSADMDFRVESNGNANMLCVDAGNDRVGIGTNTPSAITTIKTASNEEDAILIEQSDGTDVGALRINNGSFVLSGRSTSQPVQIQTHDGNEDIEVDPDGFIKMETAGAERLRIDASGNVGINSSAPNVPLLINKAVADHTSTAITIRNSQDGGYGSILNFESAQTNGNILKAATIGTDGAENWASTANTSSNLKFSTMRDGTLTEAGRFTKDGNLFVGTTDADLSNNTSGQGHNIYTSGQYVMAHEGNNMFYMNLTAYDSGTEHYFVFLSDGNTKGTIGFNGSSTVYATSSDYRLKENVVTEWDATTRLKQLKPSRFNFIENSDNTVDGFLAHEVSDIVPEAVSGKKDAMTEEVLYVDGDEIPDGKKVGDVKVASKIDPQGIDQSKLVPLLVKTIQELEARITALESA